MNNKLVNLKKTYFKKFYLYSHLNSNNKFFLNKKILNHDRKRK